MAVSWSDFVTGAYFDVMLGGDPFGMSGQFTSVSGLGMEFEYETYTEGGSNYPHFFMKNVVPQTLVLEQGTITTVDTFAATVNFVNLGMRKSLDGIIMLKDYSGSIKRTWTIIGAQLTKYIGPSLDSNSPQLAVNRIEFTYNGCT